ncbi:MAG: helix-turn-helix domain-containing protein [archaeon]
MREDDLVDIGLSKNEARAYYALLNIGTAKIAKIIRNSDIKSGKIYDILYKLKDKGLVSEIIINGVKHFSASPPNEILSYLNQEKEKLNKKEQTIKKVIMDLNKIHEKNIEETKIFVYKGMRGLKIITDELLETLNKGDMILTFGATIRKEKKFTDFWKKWAPQKRYKKGILERSIMTEKSQYALMYSKKYNKYEKVRYLEFPINFPVTFNIWPNDRVIIYDYNPPYNFIMICDKNIAGTFRNYFEQLWKIAKPV